MNLLLIPLIAFIALPKAVNQSLIALNDQNNNCQNSHLLISYGGNSPKDRAEKEYKKEKAKLLFKKRNAAKKAAEGLPLTEEEKKIIFYESVLDDSQKKYN